MISPFLNDPFALVWQSFKNLYPDKDCECMWIDKIETDVEKTPYGYTNFGDDGNIQVVISGELPVLNAVEIFAHELAHVAAGLSDENEGHSAEWEDAFEKIFQEYNRISSQLENAGDTSGAEEREGNNA